jgi:hypothetical protein
MIEAAYLEARRRCELGEYEREKKEKRAGVLGALGPALLLA